jgi:S1-C subfamily serine protease
MGRRVALMGLFTAGALLALGIAGLVAVDETREGESPPVQLVQNDGPPPDSRVADVIEAVLPSVVNVRVIEVGFDPAGDVQEGRGQGSGVVVDESGTIVTNFHVIQNAVEVEVRLAGGGTVTGEVLGSMPEHDLAVISIEADDLTPIPLGRSESLRLGDDVLAIGFPLGLRGPTVTKGIVSALGRTIEPLDGPRLTGVIQTDAAINPGNSGGAMVDLGGMLVGINTAAARAAAAENIGFAIPIDDVVEAIEEILRRPPQERAWLGVAVETLDEERAAELGVSSGGALVAGVYPDSPAADAGIETGEIITHMDGELVEGADELIAALRDRSPDDEVELEIVSEEGRRTVTTTLAARPLTFEVPQE